MTSDANASPMRYQHAATLGAGCLVALAVAATAWWSAQTAPLARPFSSQRQSNDRSVSGDAPAYVQQRPFDAIGWLAWAGADGAPQSASLARGADAKVAIASRLAPFDPQVLRSQALLFAARGDFHNALLWLDRVAQLGGEEGDAALTSMLAFIGGDDFHSWVATALAQHDPVVDALLLRACRANTELPRLARFVESVIRARPIPDSAVDCIANRAIDANLAPFAQWVWLNGSKAVPKTMAYVLNGDFEGPIDSGPFAWKIHPGGEYRDGFSARVRPTQTTDGGKKLLEVRFNGRTLRPPVAQQVLVLPVGAYTLSYRSRPSDALSGNRLLWQVRCLGSTTALSPSERAAAVDSTGWITVTTEFTVAAGCSGQLLTLEAASPRDIVDGGRGSVAFDDVQITRR